MTPLQMMAVVLKALADPQLLWRGVAMKVAADGGSWEPPPPPSSSVRSSSPVVTAFRSVCCAVLVDGSGWVNVVARVSEGALLQVTVVCVCVFTHACANVSSSCRCCCASACTHA